LVDDRFYIGSATNFKNRWKVHKCDLLKNKHHSIHLQRFVNKHGISSLDFLILEYCEVTELLTREQYYLDVFAPKFNCSKIAGNAFLGNKNWVNRKHTDESKKKMRDAKLGKPSLRVGKTHTENSIMLMSKNRKGTKVSAEVIKRRNATRQLNKLKNVSIQ
jgi:group I intron endonuclease